MNRGHLSELRRTALTRLSVVLAIALALVGGLSLLAGPDSPSPPSIATVYYYADGAYHLMAFVYDGVGRPVAGLTVQFSSPQGLPAGGSAAGTTDSAGVVVGTFPGS